MTAPSSSRLGWQIALLVPLPPLSVLYLLAIRAEWLTPRFAPLLAMTVLPLASAIVGARQGGSRRSIGLLALAAAEVLWAVLALAMVGFAIAWRSG